MRAFRSGHLFVTAGLFVVSLLLYAADLPAASAGVFFLGVAVELFAWVLVLTDPGETDFIRVRE